MSERIYAWLLRLYPVRFRETYRDAALELFRDRARHERGVLAQLRLWADLFADLIVSVPREYRRSRTSQAVAVAGAVPSFHILDGESPRPSAVFVGGILSLAAAAALSIVANRVDTIAPIPNSSVLRRPAVQQEFDRMHAESLKLDAAERARVIEGVIANLERYYVDPAAARKIADSLATNEKAGKYDAQTDGAGFADLLTRDMRDVSRDRHLAVEYSENVLPTRPPPRQMPPEAVARYRQAMEQQNCTFERVETLAHNIGYLKLNSFPDPPVCEQAATSAMASLNHSDALIFDLRDNGGGFPDMVALMASYLFDHPEYLYNPRENTTERSWTRSPVPGNQLADKPVFVLTSPRTASGAEQFTYDLRMLKRVTVVGETTRGSAHSGVFHRIDDHFGMGIPEVKPINPFSKSDWEGIGIEPDVKVKADDALAVAQRLVEKRPPPKR